MAVKVALQVKSVTGRRRYYPVGDMGKQVVTLTGKKTISELEVEALKALGVELVFVNASEEK